MTEVQTCALPISGSGFSFSLLVYHFTAQIYVSGLKNATVYVRIYGSSGTGDLISMRWVKCIFKFYLARVNSIPVEFTSAR